MVGLDEADENYVFINLEINLSGYVRNFFECDGLEYRTQWKCGTINMGLAKSFVP